ncbi:L-ascorbate metabolism protein UlaG, beta-lactamase superfamily [Parasphingorhabdus marina DSM 22363]|uniref:L-ascorbate metabolism protein UlaG, beta-lactamase superfamily n=1 Tax=Parasphingorhabdus marina DSM 22363 TaxID=1123272 RepID=A0A1N6D1C4_9SPHN|nr:MBL fold metallo-hydrolase [Parasphingorhabdus marina]SIN64539.1 L-ascorbate metabolism protein UlaG, beta-lactamase superfamily [Parasphingorhabdus marina DSM 22363]
MRIIKGITKILILVLIIIGASVGLFMNFAPSVGGDVEGERLARVEKSPHHKDGEFDNVLPPSPTEPGWIREQIEGQFFGDEQRYPPAPIPLVEIPAGLFEAPVEPGLRAIWLGHASSYLEIDGVRILIDPVFSDYASPLQGMGPKRFHKSPIDLTNVPEVDAVLISHDHYDHLDMETIKALVAKGARIFVPLGAGTHLDRWDIPADAYTEFDWGQSQAINGVQIISTEARHYSGRGLMNQRETFWSSWTLIGPEHRAYYSGDTGYSGHFVRIAREYGPFDLSIIKIGAYGPGAAWTDVHMSAEDAVQAHVDLGAKEMLPVHWSTFNLGFHAWNEPIELARAAADKQNILMHAPRVGELVEAGTNFRSIVWWDLKAGEDARDR